MTNKNGLSPLNLVDFERYMLADDAPDYPMVIPVKLKLTGTLHRDPLETAYRETIELSPLMSSKVEVQGRLWNWVKTKPAEIHWDQPVPNCVKIDLFSGSGVQTYVNRCDNGVEVTLFIHHSVCDGSGICEFVETWLKIYRLHLRVANEGSGSSDLQALHDEREQFNSRLPDRGKFGMNFFKYLLRPFQEFCGLIGTIEYFSHRPTSVGKSEVSVPDLESLEEQMRNSQPGDTVNTFSHRQTEFQFSEDETRLVLKNAKSTNYKVNDMMVASMQDACQKWLENHRAEDAHRPIRIMIPMDMRDRKNREKYVANNVSMVFLDRRPGRYRSVQHLCWYGWLEMTPIKMMKLGLTFAHLIRYCRFRNRLHKLLRRDRCIATTILSNMGPVFRQSDLLDDQGRLVADQLTVQDFQIYPPIRPYTWLSSLLVTYRNKFVVCSNWCSENLTSQDVDEILTKFKHNLLHGFTNHSAETETKNAS